MFDLKPYELRVVEMRCQRLSRYEIAKTLSISERTVSVYLTQIYAKWNVPSESDMLLDIIYDAAKFNYFFGAVCGAESEEIAITRCR